MAAANGPIPRLTILEDTNVEATTKLKRELAIYYDAAYKKARSIETFLDYDATLRLRRMPHKGSSWDKILQRAGYFASQSYLYAEAIDSFAASSQESAAIIRCCIILLLELGSDAAVVLEPIFGQFYDISLTLESLHRNQKLFESAEIQHSLASLYADVVLLAAGISSYYGHRSESGSYLFVSEEFHSMYSTTIVSIQQRRESVSQSMWSYSLKQAKGIDTSIQIGVIRSFLSPSDLVVRTLLQKRARARSQRDEMTCEWFQGNLTKFLRSNDKLFLVSGKAGSGKSILSAWVAERLKRAQGAKSFDVLVAHIEPDIPAQATTLSVIKGLLLQLLDRNVGDTTLYAKLVAAMKQSTESRTLQDVENSLWPALQAGLEDTPNLVIVVDGLNHLQNSSVTASGLVENLNKILSAISSVKVVLFTQEYKSPGSARHFEISSSDNRQDILFHIEHVLETSDGFSSITAESRQQTAQKLTNNADGSFIWADFALELLRRGESIENIPKSTPDLLKKISALINMKSADTRSLVAWLLAAQRPLKLTEIRTFLEIDLSKVTYNPGHNNVEAEVLDLVGPLVTISEGFVQLKNSAIRAYLLERASSVKDMSNTGDFPFMMKEAHYDLTARCHAYLKLFLNRRLEPTGETVKASILDAAFDASSILEYTMTYWMRHFLDSPMYSETGKHKLVPQFRDCFCTSVFLAASEMTLWTLQTTVYSSLEYLELAHTIRQSILKDSKATLQTILILAKTYEALHQTEKATNSYYQAFSMSSVLYGESNEIASSCSTKYMTLSKTINVTEHTETAIQKERILKHIIKVQKNSSQAVTYSTLALYTTMLAQLYTERQQYDEASAAWKEVHSIAVSQYGKQSKEATSLYQSYISTLEKSSKKEELQKVQKEQISTSSTGQRQEMSLHEQISYYESKQDFARAEEILVNHWRLNCQAASSSDDAQLHKAKLDTTLLYVYFLKARERQDEAGNIVRGVWSEYEARDLHSEEVVSRLSLIGNEMRTLGLVAAAVAVFSSIFAWYKKSGKEKEATEAQNTLNESTKELVEKSTENTQTITTSTSAHDESSVLDVWRSLAVVTAGTTVSASAAWKSKVQVGETLSASYYRQEHWSECISICKELLANIWASFYTRDSKESLPELYRAEAIRVATREGDAYYATKQIEKAEEVYRHVFHSTLASLKCDDAVVTTSFRTLSIFYDKTFKTDKKIKILQELYTAYKTQLGAANSLTIAIAYEAGDLCVSQSRPRDAEPYFLAIYSSLGDSKDTFVHKDAMKAAENLSVIYEQQQRWDAAEGVYRILWQTWVKRGKEYSDFTRTFVEKLYTTYLFILQDVKKVSYREIYQLTKAYRETCKSTFGAEDEQTVKATLKFAEVADRSDEHRNEAIELYEEITETHAKKSGGSTAAAAAGAVVGAGGMTSLFLAISKARQRLNYLYTTQSTTSSKAVALSSESYEESLKQRGYAQAGTLQRLKEYVTICSKQQSSESKAEATSKLNNAVAHIVAHERDSERLFNAAHAYAEAYILLGQKDVAFEILREMRRQVITEDYTSRSKTSISMKGTDRRSYVFIIAFSQTLLSKAGASAFSELMADLMTETILYQSFKRASNSKSSFEEIYYHGSRLALFYKSKNRGEEYDRTINELVEHFAAHLGLSQSSKGLREFFEIYFRDYETRSVEQIVEAAVGVVLTKMKAAAFQDAYDLAVGIDKFVRSQGSWASTAYVDQGFELCLHLTGRSGTSRPSDASTFNTLVGIILKDVIRGAKAMNLRFIVLPVARIDGIAGLLSEIKDFESLEWILTQLWQSRHEQTSWSSTQIVWIGRRLVEVRFLLNKQDAAIQLCQDITYNLRRTWGPADKLTVDMFDLLSALYTSVGDHKSAIAVHEDVLRSTLASVDEDGDTTTERGAAVSSNEFELLHRAYLRNGGFEKSDAVYKDLYEQISATMGSEKSWTAASNSPAGWKTSQKADDKGTWTAPVTFDFMNPKDTEQHTNNLKRTSGLLSSFRWKSKMVNGK